MPGDGADLATQRLRCSECYRTSKQVWQTDPYAGDAWVRRCGWCGHTQRGWQALKTWAFMYSLPIDTAKGLAENVARWPEEDQRDFMGDPQRYEEE